MQIIMLFLVFLIISLIYRLIIKPLFWLFFKLLTELFIALINGFRYLMRRSRKMKVAIVFNGPVLTLTKDTSPAYLAIHGVEISQEFYREYKETQSRYDEMQEKLKLLNHHPIIQATQFKLT